MINSYTDFSDSMDMQQSILVRHYTDTVAVKHVELIHSLQSFLR